MSERRHTLEAQIACVSREIEIRKGVYPKWVGSGRMKRFWLVVMWGMFVVAMASRGPDLTDDGQSLLS